MLEVREEQKIRRMEPPIHPEVIDDLMRIVTIQSRLPLEEGKPLTREQIDEFRRATAQSWHAIDYLMRNKFLSRRSARVVRPETTSERKEP